MFEASKMGSYWIIKNQNTGFKGWSEQGREGQKNKICQRKFWLRTISIKKTKTFQFPVELLDIFIESLWPFPELLYVIDYHCYYWNDLSNMTVIILQLIQKSPELTFTSNLLWQLRVNWYISSISIYTYRGQTQTPGPSSFVHHTASRYTVIHSPLRYLHRSTTEKTPSLCHFHVRALIGHGLWSHRGWFKTTFSRPSPFIAFILMHKIPKHTVRATYLLNFKDFFFINPLPSKPWHTPNGIWYLPFLSYIFFKLSNIAKMTAYCKNKTGN